MKGQTMTKPFRISKRAKRLIVSLTTIFFIAYFVGSAWLAYQGVSYQAAKEQREQEQRSRVELLKQDAIKNCLDEVDDKICIPKLRPLKEAIAQIDGRTLEESDFLSSFQLYGSATNSKSPDRIVDLAYALGFLDEDLKKQCSPVALEQCNIPAQLAGYKLAQDPSRQKIRTALRRIVERKATR